MDRIFWFFLGAFLCALLVKSGHVHAEGLYLEMGIGYDEHVLTGNNPMASARLRYELSPNTWWVPDVLEYNHTSSVIDGKPFNNTPEDTSDQFSIFWRFKIK